jgi:hypothetical protein
MGTKRHTTYLREYVYSHAIASSHAHSDDSMCHTPSRILAIHTCTCARFPHIGDAGACAVARPEWGQTSTLGRVDVGSVRGQPTDRRTRHRVGAYLTGTRPRGGDRSRRGHGGPGGIAIGPVGQAMRVSGVLLRPMWIARGRMALILGHVVVLRRVRRVRWVGRTRRGDGWIYGYVGVRLDVRCGMMVILMPILQGHGRTCCLSHTSWVGVRGLRCVLLTRDVVRRQVDRARRGWIHSKL